MPLEPRREGNKIIAPKRAEADDGTIGDGFVELSPGDPEYDQWDRYLRSRGRQYARRLSDRITRK